ncbi:hypothetical protein [Halobacterium noricense]|uniref:hypothetical protein n=1 Tax=Halobacterium noricense TaxID=223182 RepID=UPI001E38A674|nr:hypothetical protein [Halobacterium noricense]UHH24668.1 hypothetical protein LT974_11830 [Halobacterium noricense]
MARDMPNGMTEGQWADHHAKNEVTHSSMGEDAIERTCPICGEVKELLEHHVSYAARFGLFPVEIVLGVCMGCHHKIHKQEGFREKLNPVEHPTEDSVTKYEDFVAGLLIDCEDANLPPDRQREQKYRLYREEDEWKIETV